MTRDEAHGARTDEPKTDGTEQGGPERGGPEGDGETRGTVLVALLANLVIALAKIVGGLIAGSPALLSEAAHSVADSLNEVFLLASLSRSRRRPDARHPFGYGKERFFWSMLAAVGIFVTGGCFSFYQGLHTLLNPQAEETGDYLVVYLVLLVSLIAEGGSLARATLQVRRQARQAGRGLSAQLRRGDDPTVRTVFAEDAAAVLGVLLALAGAGLHQWTGRPQWEAAAALAIAALLMYVAYRLGRDAKDLLVGQAVDPAVQQKALDVLTERPEVDTVTRLLTMRLGPGSALLAARIDLVDGLDSNGVEELCVQLKQRIRSTCPDIDQVFLDITAADEDERRRAAERRRKLRETVRQETAAGS
ncbi:cation diffusion facilitator family transporter [Kitasatospora phosalacinea]|uniref:cation diffusion facilitator family transporter n=1 Tax=Kitasatospora phosalacinea TaxID=2065 RepID=UPI0009DD3099|nr:cation diffusion facilitator family transporter [Kitasatospora phosalacinea]